MAVRLFQPDEWKGKGQEKGGKREAMVYTHGQYRC